MRRFRKPIEATQLDPVVESNPDDVKHYQVRAIVDHKYEGTKDYRQVTIQNGQGLYETKTLDVDLRVSKEDLDVLQIGQVVVVDIHIYPKAEGTPRG